MEEYSTLAPVKSKNDDLEIVAPGVFRMRILFVNVYLIKNKGAWALIDAGLWGAAPAIINVAESEFGKDLPPESIFLTHGHFDHIGALTNLLPHWKVPIYAHPLEFPYLTGKSNYPPPDPTVGGGALAAFSWLFPNNPINIKEHLMPYTGATLPGFPEWKVIHTPGHSPGHVSFFREEDGTLIAGDAFVTVKQESVSAVVSQTQEVHGPPAYFTCDWQAAGTSVSLLASLNPQIAACGHGTPMKGKLLEVELSDLASNFELKAVPEHGRYVFQPAITNEEGVLELPPPVYTEHIPKLIGIGAAIIAGIIIYSIFRKDK